MDDYFAPAGPGLQPLGGAVVGAGAGDGMDGAGVGGDVAGGDRGVENSKKAVFDISGESFTDSSEGDPNRTMGFFSVTFNLVTAMVGVGIFGLIGLGRKGGLYIPIVCLVIAAAILYEASLMYMQCSLEWNRRGEHIVEIQSLETFGFAAFGQKGKLIYAALSTILHLGICSLFAQQAGTQIRDLFDLDINVKWIRLWFAPFFYATSMFHSLKALERISWIGAVAVIISTITMISKSAIDANEWKQWPDTQNERDVVYQWPSEFMQLGSVTGITFVSYGITGSVPTMAADMKQPEKMPLALFIAVGFVLFSYGTICLLGHLAYGDFVCADNPVLNLKYYPATYEEAFDSARACSKGWTGSSNQNWAKAAASVVAPNLLLSYPLIMMTVIRGLQDLDVVMKYCPQGSVNNYVLRTVLVTISLLIGIFCDKFIALLGFYGSLVHPFMTTLLPFVCSWRIRDKLRLEQIGWARMAMQGFFLAFALFALVFGVYDGIVDLFLK